MRFVIYGAGAIGGILGARLHEGGREVILVARGAHYAALRQGGLRLVEPSGGTKTLAIPVAERIGEVALREDDVVLLTMKTQDSEGAVRELVSAAPAEIAVVCVQNGLESERIALRRFANVYGVAVICPGVHLEPGVVEAGAAPISGILDIGRYPFGADAVAQTISEHLRACTYLSEARQEIMPWKRAKHLRNVSNALMTLAGPGATATEFGKLLRAEAEAVFAKAGLPVTPTHEFDARSKLLPRHPSGRPGNSSWQSVARKTGSIESDYLNGEIVLLARQHGTRAPANELVQRLARELVDTDGEPSSVTVEQIAEQLFPADAVGATA